MIAKIAGRVHEEERGNLATTLDYRRVSTAVATTLLLLRVRLLLPLGILAITAPLTTRTGNERGSEQAYRKRLEVAVGG